MERVVIVAAVVVAGFGSAYAIAPEPIAAAIGACCKIVLACCLGGTCCC